MTAPLRPRPSRRRGTFATRSRCGARYSATTSRRMADPTPNTAERAVSKPREEIIRQAKRMEEGLLYSSKGHFAASAFWSKFHLWIGIPMVILAAVAGANAFKQFDPSGVAATVCSMIVV